MLDIIIINRIKLSETFWPNTKLVDAITLEVISDLEILSIWILIPSLKMIQLLVQIKLPPSKPEDKSELSQVPKTIQISLKIHLIGIATHFSEEANICNITPELKNLNLKVNFSKSIFNISENKELKLRIGTLSMVKNLIPMQLIASLVQIKPRELMLAMVTQTKSIQIPLMMELTFREDLDTTNLLEILMIAIQTLSAHTMECTVLSITLRFSRASNKRLDTTIKTNINQEISKTPSLALTKQMHMTAITTL
jgi:hypothetical protein